MPSNHYSGSYTSRPEMGIMGIVNRARGMQIAENGFHVRMMFLLLGLLLSIVNLPTASGQTHLLPPPSPPPSTPPGGSEVNPITPPPPPPPPSPPPPPQGVQDQPPPGASPPSSSAPTLGPPPPLPSVAVPAPSPVESPPHESDPPLPPPPSTTPTTGTGWNESEKAGVVIASIAALLQVAVVAFLLIKRHQMLTTVEYDDIEDLDYDTPPNSNFRDIEAA